MTLLRWSRSTIVRVHRSIAIFSVIIIMFAAISGFLLQHAEDFNWHQKSIQQSWLLDLYDVQPAVPISYQVVNKPSDYATQLAHQWYINTTKIAAPEERIQGAVYFEPLWVIASETQLHLYSDALEVVESIPLELDGVITAIGLVDNRLVIHTQASTYRADENLLSFEKVRDMQQKGVFSLLVPTPPEHVATLPNRVSDIRYLRLMQDLHGGRLFGLPHWLIPDFTAFALLFLSVSGLLMRKKRQAV